MKKVAIILSGCGVFDGAEIHESVLTLLAVETLGHSYQCFAPDTTQHHVINHITGEEMPETRNVMIEAARISRGDIKPLSELNVADYDALLLPGGFGAAKNLCNFAFAGTDVELNQEVQTACIAFAEAKKPAGYLCIAPAMMPKIYKNGVKTTIGSDADTASAITQLGGEHVECPVDGIVVDEENKVVSTPAYMLANSLVEANAGISKLVAKVIELA